MQARPAVRAPALARAIVGLWTADFVSAEIGGAAGEIVVDIGQTHAGIDCHGTGAQTEIEVRWFIERARVGAGRGGFFEDVVIDRDAVPVLPRSFGVVLERFEAARFARLLLEAHLLRDTQRAHLAEEIRALRERR